MITIALTGLSGVIGTRLIESLPQDAKIIDLFHTYPTTHAEKKVQHVHFDLEDPAHCFATLESLRPDIIIHMAAITHIDRCEQFKREKKNSIVWKVNVTATETIARYCASAGSRLVFMSTECVFDGNAGMYEESADPNPINWYGYTKAVAEEHIQKLGFHSAILRSVVAFDANETGKTIFSHFATVLRSKNKLRVVDDLYFMPTYVPDITKAIAMLTTSEHTGIFHLTSPDAITPYAFARTVAMHLDLQDMDAIVPVQARDFFGIRRSRRRLLHSTLDSRRTQSILGIAGQSVESVLL